MSSGEVQALFTNANTCADPCEFAFTQDADWGGQELQITRSNIAITLRGVEGQPPITLDAKHLSRFIAVSGKHNVTVRLVDLRLVHGSPMAAAGVSSPNGAQFARGGAVMMNCYTAGGSTTPPDSTESSAGQRRYAAR